MKNLHLIYKKIYDKYFFMEVITMELLSNITNKKGHYSPGVIMNGNLYISGQLPINPATGKIDGTDIVSQTKQALENVERVLSRAGAVKTNVGLCRVYLSDISLWDTVNDLYADFFGSHRPARVVVPTRNLHYGALIEIEAVAEMPNFVQAS